MLPRAARLRRNRDFRAVYSQRRSYSCSSLVLYVRATRQTAAATAPAKARIGFVISKKVAKKAHDRNLLKRRLREICRLQLLPRLRGEQTVDILFVARSAATAVDFARLAADVESLGRQAGLL